MRFFHPDESFPLLHSIKHKAQSLNNIKLNKYRKQERVVPAKVL